MARRRTRRPRGVLRWMRVKDGPTIKRWRKRRDLTQRQLAYLVSKSQTTIHLIETGGLRNITEKLALDIAKRLDVPWEDLFDLHESTVVPDVTDGVHTAA